MHRILVALTCVTVLVVAVFAGSGPDGPSLSAGVSTVDTAGAGTPTEISFSAPGNCVAGCAIAQHPIEALSEAEYLHLIEKFGAGDGAQSTYALESLLFHAADTRGFIETVGTAFLDEAQTVFLLRELERTHVRLWLRVVDESGVVRAQVAGERFPIGERTHMNVEDTHALPAAEISGTVYRTGLDHLWVRM